MSGSRRRKGRKGPLVAATLLLAAIPVLVLTGWLLWPYLTGGGERGPGDGRDVNSYGFDLEPLLLPAASLVASGFPRDGVPAMTDPPTMTPAEADAMNGEVRGKYLVSEDRVIGLVIDGVARAYPIRVLNWHEVVNDRLAGIPVAISYHPLCDSVAVFDRRVDGTTLELGVSGLLYNSNLLLYDRQPAGQPSLWSQLQARAIAGPAAARGQRLQVIPSWVTSWARWREMHPQTTVLRPDREQLTRYRRNPYGGYFRTGKPPFPVSPWPDGGPDPMSTVVVEQAGAVRPPGSAAGPAAFHALWFAWFSHHPDAVVHHAEDRGEQAGASGQ